MAKHILALGDTFGTAIELFKQGGADFLRFQLGEMLRGIDPDMARSIGYELRAGRLDYPLPTEALGLVQVGGYKNLLLVRNIALQSEAYRLLAELNRPAGQAKPGQHGKWLGELVAVLTALEVNEVLAETAHEEQFRDMADMYPSDEENKEFFIQFGGMVVREFWSCYCSWMDAAQGASTPESEG